MSTSYFMNIGAYVATVIFAAARLAVGGVLTEPGALVPALLVLGILLIPLASKGGFQKSTYQTGPAFGLAWGVLYALTPAQLSSDRISGVLEASLEGLSFSFKDNLAVFCIGLLLLVGLSAVRKYFPNAALNVLRYAILILMQLLAFEGMFRYLLDALTLEKGAQKQSIYRAARLLVWAAYILLLNWRAGAMRLDADDCWLISVLGVPVAGAVYELLEQKGQVTAKWYHAPLALLALLTVSMAALQDMRFILLLVGLGVLWWICARLGTLAGKYKVVMQGFWGAAAMLLLAASRQLGTREAIPANWLVALALLGVSWCVLTVFLSVRYRAANAMEIYPEEYSTVYRLCNVVPLLAAVLAAMCVVF